MKIILSVVVDYTLVAKFPKSRSSLQSVRSWYKRRSNSLSFAKFCSVSFVTFAGYS